MTEQEFKDRFVCNFLSGWVVQNYEFCCTHGKHAQLDHPPVEDAIYLADAAWKEYQDKKDA